MLLLSLLVVLCGANLHYLADNDAWSPVSNRSQDHAAVVVLLAGHVRSFNLTEKSIMQHLVKHYNADVAMCITDDEAVSRARAHTDSWMGTGHVIFREFLPAFAVREREDTQGDDHLPLDIDHQCPTDCPTNELTPLELPDSLRQLPPFPTKAEQRESFERDMFNQFYAWYACHEMLKRYEKINKHTYSVVVRHRFDAALWMNYPDLEQLSHNTMYVPKGFNYGGLNDRMWISDRRVAEIAFSTLLMPFLKARQPSWFCPPREYALGPETTLAEHIAMHNITVDRSIPFAWALIDERTGCARYQHHSPQRKWGKHFDADAYALPYLKQDCRILMKYA